MPPAAARQLDDDLWLLDLDFQATPGVIAAFLLKGSSGHTLIETGPGSTLGALERAVTAAGARLDDVTQLAVTHIHLDHAGAAGTLLRRLPDARLLVHPAGAPHMIDPSRLIASATRIYGDRMDRLWGAFDPCPAERRGVTIPRPPGLLSTSGYLMWQAVQRALEALATRRNGGLVVSCGSWQVMHSTPAVVLVPPTR